MQKQAVSASDVAEDTLHFFWTSLVDYILHTEVRRNPSVNSIGHGADSQGKMERLDTLGRDIGRRWIEKLAEGTPIFSSELDKVKFICKEFWVSVFNKQIDNLKTNNKGTYVLSDKIFKNLLHVSETPDSYGQVEDYVIFPAGLVRGAFEGLGLNCEVNSDCSSPPQCIFTITLMMNQNVE
eukprot:jgi/Galph1/317/GphlegSOOS_G5070.1